MIIDMRYHIASLAAVFFALALGILIGSVMGGDKALVEQQKRLIDRLEEDFSQARTERTELEAKLLLAERRLRASEAFEEMVIPSLIRGRLLGMKVAIIRTSDGFLAAQEAKLKGFLEKAGAEVVSSTIIKRGLELLDSDPKEEILRDLGLLEVEPEKVTGEIAWGIASELGRGVSTSILPILEKSGFLKRNGKYDVRVDAVVILGGAMEDSSNNVKSCDLPLIYALKGLNIPVVGVETSNVRISYEKSYRSAGISSVDNADMTLGLLSLVYTLSGHQGNFGIKEHARRILPEVFEAP